MKMSKFEILCKAHEGESMEWDGRNYIIGRYEYKFPLLPRVWLEDKYKHEIRTLNEDEFLKALNEGEEDDE